MNSVLLMEWNEKPPSLWDLENLFMFGAKVNENPRSLQSADCGIEGEQGMASESFYSTGGDGGSGVSGSDLGDGSYKSSKSASVSSSVGESKKSNFNLEASEGFPKDFIDIKESAEAEALGSSPSHEVSAGSGEPFLSLKLGKRMYFEDVGAGNNPKTKRFKPTGRSTVQSHCQVEGCNIDLSSAKDYHRKHRICENHSKSPKVIVDGVELRFCQQCSRFHGLTEFDERKRSCRRRLSDHNARRRKPHMGAMRNPSRLSSSMFCADERMSLALDQYTRHASSLSWDGTYSFKFAQTKEYFPSPAKGGSTARQLSFSNNEIPSSATMLHHDSTRQSPAKGIPAEIHNRGGEEESMISFNLDARQDIHRALSLLSTSSWVSRDAKPASLDNTNQHYDDNMPQPGGMHANVMTQALPPGSSEYWHPYVDSQAQVTHSHGNDNGTNHFEGVHQFKGPYEFGYHTSQFS